MMFIPEGASKEPKPGICICPGIPRVPRPVEEKGYPDLAESFCRRGMCGLIFNFRGTAVSEGEYSLSGWAEDLSAAIDYLTSRAEVDSNRVGILGFSGGAIVSIYNTARDSRVKFLISCSCPSTLSVRSSSIVEGMAHLSEQGVLRVLDREKFLESLKEDSIKFEPLSWVDKISPRPILIVHGARDELVSVENAHELYRKAKEPKNLLIVENAGHRIRESIEAIESMVKWTIGLTK